MITAAIWCVTAAIFSLYLDRTEDSPAVAIGVWVLVVGAACLTIAVNSTILTVAVTCR
jgi:hypothetical protein